MNFASSLNARIETLLKMENISDPIERWRKKSLVSARLAAVFATLALAPLYLAIEGAPTPRAVFAFVCLMSPLVSVALLVRTGRLTAAQAFAAASFVGVGLCLGLDSGRFANAAFAWLILAPLEGAMALDYGLISIAAAAAGAAALAIALQSGPGPTDLAGRIQLALLATPPLIYTIWSAAWLVRYQRMRTLSEKMGSARLDSLSDALGDIVLRHDRGGAVLSVSGDSQALFGLSPRELTGRGFFERVHVADRPIFLTAISDPAEYPRTATATLRLRVSSEDKAQERFEEPVFAWVELRARRLALAGATGEADGVVAVVRDVTAQKNHEREVEDARLEAERTAAWKDRFLASVSHELRTPLNAIIGFSEILASPELSPRDPAKNLEYAQIIHSSGQHLLEVVNSILDMSKIDAGRFDVLPEGFDIGPLIASCCDMISIKAQAGNVELVRSCAPGLGDLVADKRACKQILLNLLSNAVKFTPPGGRVSVEAYAEGAWLVIMVADTGIGVGARDLPRLGDAFFQARSTYDRPYEGTGLGLSVVRGLVGLHGGTMSIESAPGEGTCVTVRLPSDGSPVKSSNAPARIETIPRSRRSVLQSLPVPMVKKIA